MGPGTGRLDAEDADNSYFNFGNTGYRNIIMFMCLAYNNGDDDENYRFLSFIVIDIK